MICKCRLPRFWSWVGIGCWATAIMVANAQEIPWGATSHWKLRSDRVQGQKLKPVLGGPSFDPGPGLAFVDDPGPPHLEFDGQRSQALLAENPDSSSFPKGSFTVEAWARPSSGLSKFALLGWVESQPFESTAAGWFLGSTEGRWSFSVATSSSSSLFKAQGSNPARPGLWAHVVGVYNQEEANLSLYVDGERVAREEDVSGTVRYPDSGFFELGAFHDQDEWLRFTGSMSEVIVYSRALEEETIKKRFQSTEPLHPQIAVEPEFFEVVWGPFLEWVGPQTVEVTWEVEEEMKPRISWKAPNEPDVILAAPAEEDLARTSHRFLIHDVQPNLEYTFRLVGPFVGGRPTVSPQYMFDSSFDYRLPRLPAITAADSSESRYGSLIDEMRDRTGMNEGYCLILGLSDGDLALELATQTEMQVIAVEPNAETRRKVRDKLSSAGVYGSRVSVLAGNAGDNLPFGPYMANWILSESTLSSGAVPAWSAKEIFRVLRPCGGVAWLGSMKEFSDGSSIAAIAANSNSNSGNWNAWAQGTEAISVRWIAPSSGGLWVYRDPLVGAGDWTHQYGAADNSSCSQDEIVQGEMNVLWWGDPGPRPMPDRGPRNPAPLSANGRMYVQGDRMLIGMDAYNGTILWNISSPEVRRANLPRDCSNTAASNDWLYFIQGSFCGGIDGQTGERVARFDIPQSENPNDYDWGYLGVLGDLLIGSAVKRGSSYKGDDGEWYEDINSNETSRVTSKFLFAMDRHSGEVKWVYENGVIMNSTITIGDGVIYMIESLDSAAKDLPYGRISVAKLLNQQVTAIDLNSGSTLWEEKHDFSELQYMTYMTYSSGSVVVTGTNKDKVYHTYAFNATKTSATIASETETLNLAGSLLWQDAHKEDKGHHSGHLQHPVVIGDVFYSDQRAFNLKTGELVRKDLPERRGCGTMSGAKNSIFFRHYFHGMWDLKSDKRTQFEGIRSGCWLGIIPTQGLALAPETSAGCSCAHSIQTSVAYVPRSSLAH